MHNNRLHHFAMGCLIIGALLGFFFASCGQGIPCKSDADCPAETFCETTTKQICTSSCVTTADCPANHQCTARKQCVLQGSEVTSADSGGTPDTTTNEPGTPGEPAPDDAISPEPLTDSAFTPAPSPSCPTLTRECYTGAPGTKGKGPCRAGKQRCTNGTWGPCVGEVIPQSETCNGIDNNCDGKLDTNCSTWATSVGSTDGDEGNGIAMSPSGDIYVTGTFSRVATFGGIRLASQGQSDAFLAKLTPNGQFVWAKAIGGTGLDSGVAVSTDTSGKIYVTGSFTGKLIIGVSTLTSQGSPSLYVAQFAPDGKPQWAAAATAQTGGLHPKDIDVSPAGHITVTGSFSEQAQFGSTKLQSKGEQDLFVARMNDKGQWEWAISAGGSDTDVAVAVASDTSGNAYITGYFQETVQMGTNTLSSPGYTNAFVAKLDTKGTFSWATATKQSWFASGTAILVDKGNLYIAGTFENEAIFGTTTLSSPYGIDVFVAKISPSGSFSWITHASGYETVPGRGLGVDASGQLYLVGTFVNNVTFGSSKVSAPGYPDIFVTKLSAAGKFLSATSLNGKGSNKGNDLAVGSDGKVYIIGTYRESITADKTTLSSQGYTDAVIAHIKP